MNNRKRGSEYENYAAEELRTEGCIIVETNYRCKFGEIDIIALDGEYLVFVEVKYRKNKNSGYPEEAVSASKQKRISLTADYYCITNGISEKQDCRFDVIAVDDNEIRHYKDAFMYAGSRY